MIAPPLKPAEYKAEAFQPLGTPSLSTTLLQILGKLFGAPKRNFSITVTHESLTMNRVQPSLWLYLDFKSQYKNVTHIPVTVADQNFEQSPGIQCCSIFQQLQHSVFS